MFEAQMIDLRSKYHSHLEYSIPGAELSLHWCNFLKYFLERDQPFLFLLVKHSSIILNKFLGGKINPTYHMSFKADKA